MKDYRSFPIIAQGANDIFLFIGFCPEIIRITEWATGLELMWYRLQGNDSSLTTVAAGDKTVSTDKGVVLGHIEGVANGEEMTADTQFTAFTDCNWSENGLSCNAVKLTADAVGLTDHALLQVEVWGVQSPVIRAVHDGTTNNNTYFEDSSVDFQELGVSGQIDRCQWLLYNKSNNNYCYIREVIKPEGKQKYCRLITAKDSAGTPTTAADFDTGDVVYVLPRQIAQYPLSDYGLMT